MKIIKEEPYGDVTFELPSGIKISPNRGIIGLNLKGETYEGYDGGI